MINAFALDSSVLLLLMALCVCSYVLCFNVFTRSQFRSSAPNIFKSTVEAPLLSVFSRMHKVGKLCQTHVERYRRSFALQYWKQTIVSFDIVLRHHHHFGYFWRYLFCRFPTQNEQRSCGNMGELLSSVLYIMCVVYILLCISVIIWDGSC